MRPWVLGLLLAGATTSPLRGKQAVTLEEAVQAAIQEGPRAAIAVADSAAAARVRTAREYPNPALALGYSKSPPIHQIDLEQPLEYPWVRRARIGSAELGALASATT
ncbi:MAG: hypothetical protein EXR92_00085 [Gemmatimonadetes bacterium]|nr:hypothetical protein [Gemmatimonadota bacterium]